MTELTIKQNIVHYFVGWKPASLTHYCVFQMASWWAEELAQTAEKVEQIFERQPADPIPTTPLQARPTRRSASFSGSSSRVNLFETQRTLPQPSAPPEETAPRSVKPLSHKLADGGVRFVVVYFFFPLVAQASLYGNGALCCIKIFCAVAVFNTDKEQSKQLMRSALLHGAIGVTDFAIGQLAFVYGVLYALTPSGVMNVQEVILNKYETIDPLSSSDMRSIYERCVDVLIKLMTESPKEEPWYRRLWQKLSFRKTQEQ